MIPLTIDSLKTYLESKEVEVFFQEETNQLCVTLKISEYKFPLFIRIFDGGELVQLLVFLPCNTNESTVADTARLLHFLNKEIDMPGFGMDESVHVIFYRCMVTAKDRQLDPSTFDAFFNAAQTVCQTFTAVVAAVAGGVITFSDVLKQSKEKRAQTLKSQ